MRLIAGVWRTAGSWRSSAFVLALPAYHGADGALGAGVRRGPERADARFYRMVNEIPALLMVAIVILVVVKPF